MQKFTSSSNVSYFQRDGNLSFPFSWTHRQGCGLHIPNNIPIVLPGSGENVFRRNTPRPVPIHGQMIKLTTYTA